MAAAIKIKWGFDFQVDASPRVTLNQPEIEVDSYDVTKVAVAPGASADVQVQPLGGDNVSFLVVSSDNYGDLLTYKVDADATDYKLNAPHVFLGSGAVRFIGADAPKKLAFKNDTAKAANLTVVAGRKRA